MACALVRLWAHLNSRVKVPVKQNAFQLVTEGNCVAARRGGEQPEVKEKPGAETRTRFGQSDSMSLRVKGEVLTCRTRQEISGAEG
jgi:hypothetical protein